MQLIYYLYQGPGKPKLVGMVIVSECEIGTEGC